MSRTPHVARGLRSGVRVGPVELQDPIYPIEYGGFNPVSKDAADGAERFGVTKAMMDAWALGSHRKWAAAAAAGRFADEIAPVRVPTRGGETRFDRDEFPRPDARLSTIEQLPPVFGARTITAGNAPGLNDGAAAAVVMTAARATELGLEPLAEVVAASGVTEDPTGIAWVPATAIRAVLERAGIGLDQVDLIEINEAFAAMPLVSTRILADGDESRWLALLERTNVNGGAVAIGHPVGASGLRILATLAWELRRRGSGIGVAAICGGLSQGEAVVLRVGGGRHA
jgi:acetyl-CoA C-acetyltransferase